MKFPALRRAAATTLVGLACAAGVFGGVARVYAATGQVSAYGTGATQMVTLGDSVTSGTACDCDDFGKVLAQDTTNATGGATVTNFGKPGETSTGLAQQVGLPEVRDALSRAELVVVTIGANDIHTSNADNPGAVTDALAANLDAVIAGVRQVAPRAKVVVTGYWNVARDGDVAAGLGEDYVAKSHVITDAVNTTLRQRAAAQGVLFTDLAAAYAASTPDVTHLLTADGDHPNAEGHRVIAHAVEQTLTAHELGGATATLI